ncbi:hypothetical protein FOZ61_002067 [Perkinsus olseni]|uniref:Uncharacterized protein n=1 Tax=Perkinsus olseni TaxID=32597 RepID=A0A7J6LVT2_PEROL|nr:hypothetical protein FOZ61_002067 [Perkinsus olseni]
MDLRKGNVRHELTNGGEGREDIAVEKTQDIPRDQEYRRKRKMYQETKNAGDISGSPLSMGCLPFNGGASSSAVDESTQLYTVHNPKRRVREGVDDDGTAAVRRRDVAFTEPALAGAAQYV